MPLPQRLVIWSIVCGLAAAPSFLFGAMANEDADDIMAMLLGVLTFIILYTWVTGTGCFDRFKRKAFVSRTLKIGFGTRIFLSVAFPVGMYPDIICGMISTSIVTGDIDRADTAFEVYLITIVQGTILNIVLIAYMGLVWLVQRLFMKKPSPEGMCRECGYDLRASRDVCPECGTPIAQEIGLNDDFNAKAKGF